MILLPAIAAAAAAAAVAGGGGGGGAARAGTFECGAAVERTLRMPRCTVDPSGAPCDRTYRLYVPRAACDADADVGAVLPLVFAVHCFGCTAEQMMHLASVAEAYSFVLVAPEGLDQSWNAVDCCGASLRRGVDDGGFLRRIVEELTATAAADEGGGQVGGGGEGGLPFVRPDAAYALGWSNGGYVVTAHASLFRAVAPISGHIYSDLESVVGADRPVGLFLHHGADDPLVRFSGCCSDDAKPRCCCGISEASDECVSATEVFRRWSDLLSCEDGDVGGGKSGGAAGASDFVAYDPVRGIGCRTAPGPCRANATMCVHAHGKHFNRPSFERAFPMADEIGDFFARDACENAGRSGGRWDAGRRRCACPDGGGGPYCLDNERRGGVYSASSETKAEAGLADEGIGAFGALSASAVIVLVAAAGSLLPLALRRIFGAAAGTRYIGWTPVAAKEDADVDEVDEDDPALAGVDGLELRDRRRQSDGQ